MEYKMMMMMMTKARVISALALLYSAVPSVVFATNNCNFVTTTSSLVLQASCSTDATILIPNNKTLVGQGFKITAIDPPGGNFQGPILKNAGAVANVSNLFLRSNLADVCNAPGSEVVGILLDRASGTLSSVNILISKAAGLSTCAEGVAVAAQSLPFDRTRAYTKVTVKNSTLNYNQLGGIQVSGNVQFRGEANLIKNNPANLNVSQFGIDLSNGAKGYILNNQILRHSRSPIESGPAYGILLRSAGVTTLLTNTLSYNDVAIRVSGGQKIVVRGNIIRSSTLDGIVLDDEPGTLTTGNSILSNDSQKNLTNGITLRNIHGQLTKNYIKSNITSRNLQIGISMDGSLNQITSNNSTYNTVLGILNAGTGNIYRYNTCDTSSGPPVDCPKLLP